MNAKTIDAVLKQSAFPLVLVILCWVLFCPATALEAESSYTERGSLMVCGTVEFDGVVDTAGDNSFKHNSRMYNIDAQVGWFMADNFALGVLTGYGNSKTRSDYAALGTYDSLNTNSFRLGIFLRHYFSLGRYVSFFVQSSLVNSFGKITNVDTTSISAGDGQKGTVYQMDIGFKPGFVFFLGQGVAVEASVSFFGFTYSRQKLTDNVSSSSHTESATRVDFSKRLDEMSVQVGISVYF